MTQVTTTTQDIATASGGVAGVAFGPALLDYLGQVFVYATGLSDFPEMPEVLVMGAGAALGAWLARVVYGGGTNEMFPKAKEPGE